MSKVLNEEIVKIEKLAPDIFKLTLASSHIAKNANAGQFVNIKCSDGINALLRRPVSICSVDRDNKTLDIVFQVKGTGTEFLSKKQQGETLDFIGPLGTAFDRTPQYKSIVVVGGGIGVFPLLFLLHESSATQKAAFLGFRTKELVVLEKDFKDASHNLFISTDDGSYGNQGLVTLQLEEYLKEHSVDLLYTCGPTPMIKKVMEIAAKHRILCQVSLEQRMGCGIGACLVCACKTKLGDGFEYSHVCKDGPIFWAEDVILE